MQNNHLKKSLSPKKLALAMGVSEASIKRWCDQKKIVTRFTSGGHRRIALHEAIRFIRKSGKQWVKPEILGLMVNSGLKKEQLSLTRDSLVQALIRGDEESSRSLLLNLFVNGHTLCEIFDDVLAAAFHHIGDRWQCEQLDIYEERRACEMSLTILRSLGDFVPPVRNTAPLAIGATLTGDNYQLSTHMAQLVLQEAGWRTQALGTNLPATSIKKAIADLKPRLVWLSISHYDHEEDLQNWILQIYEAAMAAGCALAVGGRALGADLRARLSYSTYCDRLHHLAAFAETLNQSR